jgi:ribonuclease T2
METTRRGRRLLVSLSFLCLAVLLATASSPATAGRKRRMAGFDYYVLALQWPGSVCRQTNHCCSSNGCCR